ncbi:MAG: hypothetical protein IVW57_01335 [Ktedonobacterales bacterium]|nr:hypothetical protein [Ktedonobacterales bacterium]
MREIDRRVAVLRLLLVEINARRQQAQEAREQLRGQLTRMVDFAVRSNASVASALSALAEVEEHADQQEMTLRHLDMLRRRAQSELEALLVTRGVADAHARLAELEARRAELLAPPSTEAPMSGDLAAIEAEIAHIHATIQTASDAAARALTEGQADNSGASGSGASDSGASGSGASGSTRA